MNSTDVCRRSAPNTASCSGSTATPRPVVRRRILARQPAGDRAVRSAGLERHAGLEAADRAGTCAPRALAAARPGSGPAPRCRSCPITCAASRHHAHDRVQVAIEPDLAADDRRVAVEARPPERLAQHDGVGARGRPTAEQRPADDRLDTERVEDPRASPIAADGLGHAVGAAHHHAAHVGHEAADRREAAAALGANQQVERRDALARGSIGVRLRRPSPAAPGRGTGAGGAASHRPARRWRCWRRCRGRA